MDLLKFKYRLTKFFALPIVVAGLIGISAFTSGISTVEPEEYLEAYKANREKLSKTTVVDKAEYSLLYVPNEVRLIALEMNGNMTEALYEGFVKDRKGYAEFILQLKIPEAGTNFLDYAHDENTTYEERLKYYSFGMQQDLTLIIDEKDTIACSDFVYEPNFGLSPKGSFTIGFSGIGNYSTLDIQLNNAMTGNSEVSFRFTRKDIEILPTLKKYTKWKK